MEKQFQIRTYGYNELAQLYFPFVTPHSATVMFRRWILRNQNLLSSLHAIGDPIAHQKTLTPRQVQIIVEFLGEPI